MDADQNANTDTQPLTTNPLLHYACSHCGRAVTMLADQCPHCGTLYAGIKCELCHHVAPASEYVDHECPNCHARPEPIRSPDVDLCPSCKRPVIPGTFYCGVCGWIDWGSLVWLFGLAVVFLIVVPAVLAAVGTQLYFRVGMIVSMLIGAGFAYYGTRHVLVARNASVRFSYYALFGCLAVGVLVWSLFVP